MKKHKRGCIGKHDKAGRCYFIFRMPSYEVFSVEARTKKEADKMLGDGRADVYTSEESGIWQKDK